MLNFVFSVALAVFAAVLGWFVAAQFIDRAFKRVLIAVGFDVAMIMAHNFALCGFIIPIVLWVSLAIIANKASPRGDAITVATFMIAQDALFIIPFWRAVNTVSPMWLTGVISMMALGIAVALIFATVAPKRVIAICICCLVAMIAGCIIYNHEAKEPTDETTQTEEVQEAPAEKAKEYKVDLSYISDMLNKAIFTKVYSDLDASSYPESSMASKNAYWKGISEADADGNETVNPLMLAATSNYLGGLGFDCPTGIKPGELFDKTKSTLTEKGIETFEKVKNAIYRTDTLVYTAPLTGAANKINSGSSDTGLVYASKAGVNGDGTDTWVVTTREAQADSLAALEEEPADGVAMRQMMRCGNIVINASSVPAGAPTGKTDNPPEPEPTPPTPTPQPEDPPKVYQKDIAKGTKGTVVKPNDNKGSGKNTGTGTKSQKEAPVNSTQSQSYAQQAQKTNELEKVNQEQKTGNNDNTPSYTPPAATSGGTVHVDNNGDAGTKTSAPINQSTQISKPATDTSGNAVSNPAGETKWNPGGEFGPE